MHGKPSAAIAKSSAKPKQAPRPQPGAVRRVQQVPFALEAQPKVQCLAGPRAQAVSSARRSSDGPAGPQLGLGVCGLDMRKATSLPQQPQALQQASGNNALAKGEQASPSWRQMPPAPLNGLQVGGLAVQAAPMAVSEIPTLDAEAVQELLEHWSSESETGGSEHESDEADSSGEVFDCRKFRYQRTKDASAKAGAPAAKRRTRQPETPSRRSRVGSGSPARGCTSPWVADPPSPRWGGIDPLLGRAESRLGECKNEPIEIDGAFRVADILCKFYGFPGSVADAVSVKCNVITINEAAWTGRQRQETSYGDPPMFWVRGDRAATGGLRVYDFRGDRGTVQEFENDFIVRRVEDDSTIRMRRRDQGMLCMPFLPLPVRREEPADDDDDDDDVPPVSKPAVRRRVEQTAAPATRGRPSTSERPGSGAQKRPPHSVF